MAAALCMFRSRTWARGVVAIVFVTGLSTIVLAVGKDKAMYVGGSLRDFPTGGLAGQITPTILGSVDVSKVEGRINTTSMSELVFDAGGKGTLAIPYNAVVSLAYGLEPHGIPKNGVFLITWNPLDQYSEKAHYLLSINYMDQAGSEQGVVFELGKAIVRPTLGTLEARAGKRVEFTSVDACLVYKAAEECGYGTVAELRGLTRIFVDAGASTEHRDMIVLEIEKAQLGLEVLPGPEGAEVILRFRGEEFRSPEYLQTLHGGRGEALVARGGRLRAAMVFRGTRTGAWGDKPATKFGAAFVKAYRQANSS